MVTYFSDRERGPAKLALTELTHTAWLGIAAAIRTRVNDGSFGARYPDVCPDGRGPCGTDERSFWDAMAGEVPELTEGEAILHQTEPPPLLAVMDMIEFCWRAVGKPVKRDFHSYFGHYHLKFNDEIGQYEFRETINSIFQRNQLAYELTGHGIIQRLLEPEVSQAVHTRHQTNDVELNKMLETACQKFVSPNIRVRRESLESLWDAWERIKTIDGEDKKTGTSTLLDAVAGSPDSRFRSTLESEAQELTRIGNTFQIRHSETDQERLSLAEHLDYLWYRMFALIHLILRHTGIDRPSLPEEAIHDNSDGTAPF